MQEVEGLQLNNEVERETERERERRERKREREIGNNNFSRLLYNSICAEMNNKESVGRRGG